MFDFQIRRCVHFLNLNIYLFFSSRISCALNNNKYYKYNRYMLPSAYRIYSNCLDKTSIKDIVLFLFYFFNYSHYGITVLFGNIIVCFYIHNSIFTFHTICGMYSTAVKRYNIQCSFKTMPII